MSGVEWTSNHVLGEVLRRAREALGRSPEQVGAIVGIAGRTIRRLEAGESERPRRVTLDGLAGFYGLDPTALDNLADAPADPFGLLLVLREQVESRTAPEVVEALEGVDDEAVELAMRWARSRPVSGPRDQMDDAQARVLGLLEDLRASSPRDYTDAIEALLVIVSLDRTRRGLAVALLNELRLAQDGERHRRGRAVG